jgi:hypothetical protein
MKDFNTISREDARKEKAFPSRKRFSDGYHKAAGHTAVTFSVLLLPALQQ